MKGNPSDIKGFAEDIEQAIHNHDNAMTNNSDLKKRAEQLRKDAMDRYHNITEKGFDKNGDLIP